MVVLVDDPIGAGNFLTVLKSITHFQMQKLFL
jgi:hypothetical protein